MIHIKHKFHVNLCLFVHLKLSCLVALTCCWNGLSTVVDIGLAAKKTMPLHGPIKFLLKSPLLTRFHSVSFCLVAGLDLQVSDCDIRDSASSSPNRLHKDARQKDSKVACTFICLCKVRRKEGQKFKEWWDGERKRDRKWKRVEHKQEEMIIYDYGC